MNNCTLTGRLTADVELRQTTKGTACAVFTIADNRGKDKEASFFDCVAYGKTAEFIAQYFSKGKGIAVAAEAQTRSYEDKNGNKRKVTEFIVNRADFFGGNSSEKTEPQKSAPVEYIEDDLPF